MKKTFLFLFAFNSYLTICAQHDLIFPIKNEFHWEVVEKQNSFLKDKLIKDFPNEFEFYRQKSEYGPNLTDLDSCLHVLDINDDGLDDIIFDGWSGGEPRMISIYINNGKSFSPILTDYQAIRKIIIENKRISKIYIQDWGCCCEISTVNKVYVINYSSNIPKVQLINQSQFLNNTDLPKEYFDKPIKFSIINEDYNIRLSPIINDTTEIYYCGDPRIGNSLGKIQSGSIGYALSKQIDSTGREWWYVAMSPDTKIKDSMFYDPEKSKNYKLGWISSRFVKTIDD